MGIFHLQGKNLIAIKDWTKEELDIVLATAADLKRRYYTGVPTRCLQDKTFFMLFFNDSTRTRTSFESALTQLGGHAQYIRPETMRLTLDPIPTGKGESIKDTAEVLSRMGHGIGIRLLAAPVGSFGEATAIQYEFAKHASIPVINMMSDFWHPCQAITDVMTLQEKMVDMRGKKLVIMWAYSPWARDWSSVQETAAITALYGMNVTLAYPPEYPLVPEAVGLAKAYAARSGGSLEICHDLDEALKDADVVYPRNWITLKYHEIGKEAEQKLALKYKDWIFTKKRREQLTNKAVFIHCMPIDRNNEVENELVDDPQISWVYDQAENRLHTQKAILALTMGGRL